MGMYSWECKGCDQELKMDEEVRLDGSKGIYDGYGRCGNFDYDGGTEPVAWHQKCYAEATDAEKLDETPSKYARNQGFGYPQAQCMPESTWGQYQEPPRLHYKDVSTEEIHEYLDLLEAEDGEKDADKYSFFANGHLGDGEKIERGHITDGDVERAKLAYGDRFTHAVEPDMDEGGFEFSDRERAFFAKYPTTHVTLSALAHDALNAVKRRRLKDCRHE